MGVRAVSRLATCPYLDKWGDEDEESEEDLGNEGKDKMRHMQSMLKCEMGILDRLCNIVAANGKVVAFVMDGSVSEEETTLAHKIWQNLKNKGTLLADRFTFLVLTSPKGEEAPYFEDDKPTANWRTNFLEFRRREVIDHPHLFLAEVAVRGRAASIRLSDL